MKPAAFDYARALSVEDAIARYHSADDARYLAGGQSLLAALNFRLDAPGLLIDLTEIKRRCAGSGGRVTRSSSGRRLATPRWRAIR